MSFKEVKATILNLVNKTESDVLVSYSIDETIIILNLFNKALEFKSDIDLWDAFEKMHRWLEETNILLYLNGSRYDVNPSGFLRSSSKGELAYLHHLGKSTSSHDIINIFERTTENIGTWNDKIAYFSKWKSTLRNLP